MRESWRPNKDCNILTPTLLAITISFPFSWAAQSWFPLLKLEHWVQNSDLQLIWTSRQQGYIIVLCPLNSTRWQLRPSPDLLISSTGCTCYLHRCISSFDSLAGSEVNMQHLSLSLSLSLMLLYAVWTLNNKRLSIVDGEFFLYLNCQHPGNFVPAVRRISRWIVSFLVRESFKHSVGTDRIDKKNHLKMWYYRITYFKSHPHHHFSVFFIHIYQEAWFVDTCG